MRKIKISGKDFPIEFKTAALYDFSADTGIGLQDLALLDANMTFDKIIKLIYYALKHGARKEGIEFSYSVYDITDMVDSSQNDVVAEAMKVFEHDMGSGEKKKVK